MARIKYTTTIQEELIKKAKVMAIIQNLDGANDIIEKALDHYFNSLNYKEKENPTHNIIKG